MNWFVPGRALVLKRPSLGEFMHEGGHQIPLETVKRRFRLGIRNFGTLYRNLADDWYIIDGSKATPSIVCRGSSAGIEILDSERLDDICSISPELLQ